MQVNVDNLKAFLIDSKLISAKDINEALDDAAKRGSSFKEVLVSKGKISQDDMLRVESHLLGIPFVSLKSQKIDYPVLSIIPEPVARKHNIIAYRKSGDELEVAMLDPEDLEAINFIKKTLGLRILPRATDTESIKNALIQYQKSLQAEFGDLINMEAYALSTKSGESELEKMGEEDLRKMAEGLPIVRIVDSILKHAVTQKASDIHMEPHENSLLVRYRIDGILHDVSSLPKNIGPGIAARIKILSNLRLDEKRLPQDGRFRIDTPEEKISFRVSTLPTYYGEKIVLRLLPDAVRGFTLEGLGFHGEALELVHEATKLTTGMILTTGPTGSGKTTTLYTLLDILNTPRVNISTIEDPVEYQMPRIAQTQVRPDIGLTFASGLRTLVRQDPDIIMVGEIRDGETASLAINAALTGHLVLSSMHTSSAAGAIPRILEMGAERVLIVTTLNILIAQRLVRILCKIKEEYYLKDDDVGDLRKRADLDLILNKLTNEQIVRSGVKWTEIPFYRPKRSEMCPDGYSGRLGIFEVMKMTNSIKELVLKGATAGKVHEQARSEGMLAMIEDGIFKAAQGITSIEEVLRVTRE